MDIDKLIAIIFDALSNNIVDVANKVIDDAVNKSGALYNYMAEERSKAIYEYVYNAYNPKKYKRRGSSGGLASNEGFFLSYDPDNYEIGGVVDTPYPPRSERHDEPLDDVIISGAEVRMPKLPGFPRDYITPLMNDNGGWSVNEITNFIEPTIKKIFKSSENIKRIIHEINQHV